LDSEKGELVKGPARVGKKGVSEEKNMTALKSHSEAERRRRVTRVVSHGQSRAAGPKKILSFSFATSVSKGCL
jgi:hypothetical protein